MSSSNKEEIIDLTSSLTLADHCFLTNEVINIDSDDESFDFSQARKSDSSSRRNNTQNKQSSSSSRLKRQFGDCPICWDELGNNALASTNCGHVFCLKCLEQSLKVEKRCPTCRRILKGKSSYHPLYLNKD